MTILITGGCGFLGRNIVKQLLADGYRIINYMRDFTEPFENPEHIPVYGELFDIPRLIEVIKTYEVERIIHTAGQSHPPISVQTPISTVEANVMGSMGVLEAARLTGIKRVVLYSSEAAYGNVGMDLVTIQTPQRPLTPYGVTKAAIEMMGRAYNASYGMECVSIRLGEVYGPGRITSETVQMAIDAALDGIPFRREHGRDQRLHLIHIRDAVDVSIRACFTEKVSEMAAYHATSGGHPAFGQVLDILSELIPEAEFDVGRGTLGYDTCGMLDLSETERDLGYKPQVSLRDGITEYIEYLRKVRKDQKG
ncbi:NAD(P)-dependent oxidoreductase [Lachnospiraceae bacterium 62-35]